jgi:ribose transport system ATP-binding protein
MDRSQLAAATVQPEGSLIEARNVSKSFGGVYALKDVDFDLQAGEVHALLGPNGAGKSTLIKILNGVEIPDSGTVRVAGRDRLPGDTSTVFQELSLVPSLDVTKNIFLNNEIRHFGFVDRRRMLRETGQVTERLGLHLRPTDVVANLSVAEQQLVEIAKAVHRNARVLVLDEPTATLTKNDQVLLFERLRDIQRAGVGIIYVTHRLAEVFEIADRVTAIRDGRKTLTAHVRDLNMRQLVSAIAGGDVSDHADGLVRAARLPSGEAAEEETVLLDVKGLSGDRFSRVDLTARAGEVVGIAGLIGTGRTELLETIAGIRHKSAGSITVAGTLAGFRDPDAAIRAGVALVPEDRHRSGIVLQHSLLRNLATAHHRGLRRRGGWIDSRAARDLAHRLVASLNIKAHSIHDPLTALSGGNQQKVVFGKWLQPDIKLLLLDEPTQGVDIIARQEIHHLVRDLTSRGAAAVVVSSDFDELQQLCDRIYFMTAGNMSLPVTVSPELTGQVIYSTLNERLRQK